MICDLDGESGEKVFAYNTEGDCVISALGDGNLDMPALNQQEGTFTNIDKRVVPTNAALPYYGYVLNDIANACGVESELTVDYTPCLPQEKGFEPLVFDLMPNFFDNGGNELRGYLLRNIDLEAETTLEKLDSVKTVEGDVVIYRSNPINQFNQFTNKARQLKADGAVYVSSEFLEQNGLNEGDMVEVKNENGTLEAKLEADLQISGLVAYVPTFDKNLNGNALFGNGYRFSTATIRKV
jgi:NADH-quinone oxidoreductase subunit G